MDNQKIFTIEKPWGSFRQFLSENGVTVKILKVNPNQQFSLQYHNNRNEFWYIISGSPTVTVGESEIEAKAGDEFNIEKGQKHRMKSGESETVFLEISKGEFNEDDIVRIEDDYGRTK